MGYRVAWKVSGSTDEFEGVEVTVTSHELTDLAPATAYEVRITAFNQVGDAPAATRTGTTLEVAPGQPAGLTVAVQAQTATLTWQASAEGGRPAGYHVRHKRQGTADWPDAFTTVTGTTHTLSDLTADAAYDLQVRAHNTAGQSAWTETQFTAGPEVPGVPTRLTVAVMAQTATVSWQAPTTGGTATAYHVQHKLQTETAWPDAFTTVTERTHSLSDLTADAAYDLQVRAANASGSSGWVTTTFTAGPAVPGAVRNLTATATGTSLQLTWTAPAAGGTPGGYRVAWRRAAETTADFTTTPVTGLTHTLSGLAPLTAYSLRVTAYNASGDGPPATHSATTRQVAPGIPTALTAAPQDATTALVGWTAPATGGSPDNYRLQSKTRDAMWPADTVHTTVTGLSHTLTGLTRNVEYEVRVQASNTAGQSAWVETRFTAGLPRPGAPTGVTTTYATANTLTVNWTAPAGTPAPTHYEVQVQATENLPAGSLLWPAAWQGTVVAVASRTATLTVLDGQAFQVRVRSSVGDPTATTPLRVSDWVTVNVAARTTTAAPARILRTRAELVPGTSDRYRFRWELGTTGQVPDHFGIAYNVNGTGLVRGGEPSPTPGMNHRRGWRPAPATGSWRTVWWAPPISITSTARAPPPPPDRPPGTAGGTPTPGSRPWGSPLSWRLTGTTCRPPCLSRTCRRVVCRRCPWPVP